MRPAGTGGRAGAPTEPPGRLYAASAAASPGPRLTSKMRYRPQRDGRGGRGRRLVGPRPMCGVSRLGMGEGSFCGTTGSPRRPRCSVLRRDTRVSRPSSRWRANSTTPLSNGSWPASSRRSTPSRARSPSTPPRSRSRTPLACRPCSKLVAWHSLTMWHSESETRCPGCDGPLRRLGSRTCLCPTSDGRRHLAGLPRGPAPRRGNPSGSRRLAEPGGRTVRLWGERTCSRSMVSRVPALPPVSCRLHPGETGWRRRTPNRRYPRGAGDARQSPARPYPGSSGRLSGSLSRSHRDRVGPPAATG